MNIISKKEKFKSIRINPSKNEVNHNYKQQQ